MSGTIIKSLEKALDVMELIQQTREGISLSRLSEMTGEHPNTLRSILNTLIKKGYIRQPEARGAYFPASSENPLTNLTAKLDEKQLFGILEELHFKLNRSAVYFSIINGLNLNMFAQITQSGLWQTLNSSTYKVDSMHALAQGKLVLAYLSDFERNRLLDFNGLKRFTPATNCDITKLQAELKKIRKTAFASTHDEFNLGVTNFAVGIFDTESHLAATLAISTPSLSIDDRFRQLVQPLLKNTGNQISKMMF